MSDNRILPYGFARSFSLLARSGDRPGDPVEVMVSEATPPSAIAEVSRRFGSVRLRRMPRGELETQIAQAYASGTGDAAQVIDEVESDLDLTRLLQDMPAVEDLLESADDAPVIRMINALLTQALREGASDIHIEPFEQTSVVRFRIDGALRDIVRPRKAIHASLISRIKIMSQLDIAEKRLPQDGRITLRIGGRPVDVRVSTLPTGHGERAVLRLLDKESAGRLDLSHLGMSTEMQHEFEQLIRQPHGIVLVTGPTGSGKSTTLYASLTMLRSSTTNIMTVEDPIEYEIEGVGQTQVNPRIDMSFAKALRAILRQDPDIIMIGEIRDLETAQIAVQASLTGHLVLATLHTNDAPAAVTRLLDMGIEPFLLSSSLIGVVAQRLVRKLCPDCKRFDGQQWVAQGCPHCSNSGYQGRAGIYELLEVDDEIRKQIHDRASEAEIRVAGQRHGMKTLREDGERWLADGTTTLAELLRVTRED